MWARRAPQQPNPSICCFVLLFFLVCWLVFFLFSFFLGGGSKRDPSQNRRDEKRGSKNQMFQCFLAPFSREGFRETEEREKKNKTFPNILLCGFSFFLSPSFFVFLCLSFWLSLVSSFFFLLLLLLQSRRSRKRRRREESKARRRKKPRQRVRLLWGLFGVPTSPYTFQTRTKQKTKDKQ